jgi:membrane glycosyltransferase
VSQTLFMIALLFGQKIGWTAQRRDRYRLRWSEAARVFWPQTLFGLALLLLLAWGAPEAIVWFLPFVGGLVLSVPFAVYTASPELGAAAERARFCAIPEEFEMPAELAKIMPRAKA